MEGDLRVLLTRAVNDRKTLVREVERLRHYPKVIAGVSQRTDVDRRICQDIERRVYEAAEKAEGGK